MREVRPDYDSTFTDEVVDAEDPNAIKLRGAVDKLQSMLTKLHTMDAASAEGNTIKSEVVDFTRDVLPDLAMSSEQKAELVTAVKQGMNDSHKDYFEAQKRITSLKVRPKARAVIKEAEDDAGSKDLIEAAKGMLSALSGVSLALSEASEASIATKS